MTTLLDTLRVLDLTDHKGFFCGKILADLGADVIKIEKPGGDPARRLGPFYGDAPDPEKNLHWFAYNLNKRSITLDIEAAEGKTLFKRLVQGAHIVIESCPVGYLDQAWAGLHRTERHQPANHSDLHHAVRAHGTLQGLQGFRHRLHGHGRPRLHHRQRRGQPAQGQFSAILPPGLRRGCRGHDDRPLSSRDNGSGAARRCLDTGLCGRKAGQCHTHVGTQPRRPEERRVLYVRAGGKAQDAPAVALQGRLRHLCPHGG